MGREMIFKTGGIDIPYEIVINKRLKYVRISIDGNGMKVSIPGKAYIKGVDSLLKEKDKWVRERYISLLDVLKAKKPERDWVSGESIQYVGSKYEIEVIDWHRRGIKTEFIEGKLYIYVDKLLCDEERKDKIKCAVKRWYIKSFRSILDERLIYYSGIMGVSYNDVRIKEQKTRWGSCSKKRNLNFNWKIVMAPLWVLDYVVIHELCHLTYFNHSKQFWDMVYLYMHDYKKAMVWLKENGICIMSGL